MTAASAESEASSRTSGVQAAIRSGVDSSRAPSSQVQPVQYPGTIVPLVLERLTKALGPTRAAEVMNDLLRCGGLIQSVGRSLKVQALLRGATE